MDLDHFIITFYCLVVFTYQPILKTTPLQQVGFALDLTDEEVINIEICGEYLKCAIDKDIFDIFQANYPNSGSATEILLGDVIVALGSDVVRHLDDLLAALSGDRVGATVPVRIVRGGQTMELKATVGERN